MSQAPVSRTPHLGTRAHSDSAGRWNQIESFLEEELEVWHEASDA